jgi:hypothetical protein
VKSNSLDTLLLACFGFNKFEETHPQNGLTELILKQANACLSEPYFYSAAATVPAGLD